MAAGASGFRFCAERCPSGGRRTRKFVLPPAARGGASLVFQEPVADCPDYQSLPGGHPQFVLDAVDSIADSGGTVAMRLRYVRIGPPAGKHRQHLLLPICEQMEVPLKGQARLALRRCAGLPDDRKGYPHPPHGNVPSRPPRDPAGRRP